MSAFPSNVVDILAERFELLMDEHTIIKRTIRLNDPNPCLGIFAVEWQPQIETVHMGQEEPVLNRYLYQIQNMVSHYEEQQGRDLFSINAKVVKAILYRDANLKLSLQALSETILDTRETLKRHGVARQRYTSGQVASNWSFIATTDYWIETEATLL